MSFTLRVQFTGLCLHVVHGARQEVAVLMPDARNKKSPSVHLDGTPAVAHAGYLRVDLANTYLAPGSSFLDASNRAPGDDDGPFWEVIYRFDRQTLDFGLPPAPGTMSADTKLPTIPQIAPSLQLASDLFAKTVTSPLLFRTVLRGGTLRPSDPALLTDKWSINNRLNPGLGGPIVSQFPGDVTWTREVTDRDDLTITLTNFDGSKPFTLALKPIPMPATDTLPARDEIWIKIANLCSENPLEWNEFRLRGVDHEDSDFKWFYRMFKPNATGDWAALLGDYVLPAPRLETRPANLLGGSAGDCVGAVTTYNFPDSSLWKTG